MALDDTLREMRGNRQQSPERAETITLPLAAAIARFSPARLEA
jgi:hypothetical protein